MTHEELVAKVANYTCCSGAHELAIETVLALHKPHEATLANGEWGFCCENCHHPYPCSTILAIEGALE